MSVPAGTVQGLLGPNGAGKTTLVRILATLLAPGTGRARISGVDVQQDPNTVGSLIGLAGQYAAVDETLTGVQIAPFCTPRTVAARRLAAGQSGGYRVAHPSPFDTVRNVSPGNALRQPGCRDEHGRRPDLARQASAPLGADQQPGLRGQAEELI
jgi:ABC-type uncharacterized transport system ATPase subunit